MSKQTKPRTLAQKLAAKSNWQKGRFRRIEGAIMYELDELRRAGEDCKSPIPHLLRVARDYVQEARLRYTKKVDSQLAILRKEKQDKLTSSETKEIVSQDTASKVNPPIDK